MNRTLAAVLATAVSTLGVLPTATARPADPPTPVVTTDNETPVLYDDDAGGYYLNTEDPTMEEAVEAVTELFTTDWDEEVHVWFRKTHRKRLAIDVRAAWVALHLLT